MDKEKEEIIRKFVKKRAVCRKIWMVIWIAMLIYGMIVNCFMPHLYTNTYISTLGVWFFSNFILSMYIRNVMSACPVCGELIPTANLRHSRKLVPGNGPLPESCPFCGTNFEKYKEDKWA